MTKLNGFVLFEGKSQLTGSPIVAIATLSTSNRKTGDMIQTWVLRSDMEPTEASKLGYDAAVCGSCPHRQSLGGACYVNIGQAPLSIYRAYKRGKYPRFDSEIHAKYFTNRSIRLGAYGDPAAVPTQVWKTVTNIADNHTGYTHQLRHKNFDRSILELCMVSADTPKQAAAVHEQGLRTFRVKTEDAPLMANEIECLADTKGATCEDCGLCDGATNPLVSIAINVHGSRSKRYEEKYSRVNRIPALSI